MDFAANAAMKLADIPGTCSVENCYYPGSSFFIDPDGMSNMQLLFAFLVYAYVLFVSADMIGDGAELLLLVPGYADMVGSMVLPILGAIPDGMMVLFSGVGPLIVAQENVAVGVGALAGSTIMLLTLPWILAVYAGQVDMVNGECVGYKKAAGKRATTDETGCQFKDGVTKNAWLMFITSLSYFVIQIPAYMVDDQMLKSEYPSSDAYLSAVVEESRSENKWALIGIFVTFAMFFFYLYLQYLAATHTKPLLSCLEMLIPPEPAPTSIELVKKHGLLPIIDHYRENFVKTGNLRVTEAEKAMPYGDAIDTGMLKAAKLPRDLTLALKSLFTEYAKKTAATPGINSEHMRELLSVIGMTFAPAVFDAKFKEVDKDNSKYLDQLEFLNFFYDLITGKNPLPHEAPAEPAAAQDGDGDGDDDEEEDEMPDEFKDLPPDQQRAKIMSTALKQMSIGTFLVLIFSDPMVDVLAQIGKVTGVPPFYVSFVLAPLASNASELVASYKLASRKTSTAITQSLQTLEGAACMNNTFCLSIFFVLIYYQGLAWKFTAETLSIFFIQFLVFLLVIKSNVQTKATANMIFMCYPLSLVFVYVLEHVALCYSPASGKMMVCD